MLKRMKLVLHLMLPHDTNSFQSLEANNANRMYDVKLYNKENYPERHHQIIFISSHWHDVLCSPSSTSIMYFVRKLGKISNYHEIGGAFLCSFTLPYVLVHCPILK